MTLHWASLGAALVAGVIGQLLLKAGATGPGDFVVQLLRPATIVGLGFYGLAAMLYIVALRGIPVSVAFPAAATQYVIVAMVGWFVYAEPAGLQQIGGLALIVIGVLMLATA
ncbi:DMT family transporter [Elioraea tepidiphila]|uniref:DMT family transporter n=1 Tax=Elioraea tepidiphila TaxID=457934 RepID=UPI0003607ACD|nr:EamA family transporter [Elioraea tepidiphila]